MKKTMIAAACLAMVGCVTNNPGGNAVNPNDIVQTNGAADRVAICIGLTSVNPASYNGWAGDCPGCDVDAKGLYDLMSKDGFTTKMMLNSEATWKAVRSTILESSKGLKAGNLLVVAMSGHGGRLPDDNGDEPSGEDSTLCLWDGQVRDDDFLKLINELPKGIRLVLINDQCHSEGNFKAIWRQVKRGVTFGAAGKKTAVSLVKKDSANVQLIQFAGCREANYSYGSETGGSWTQSLLKSFKSELTWSQWFEKARSRMPSNQIPVWTEYGGVTPEFRDGKVLR